MAVFDIDTKPLARLAEGADLFVRGGFTHHDPLHDATELLTHSPISSSARNILPILREFVPEIEAAQPADAESRVARWRAAAVILIRGFLASGPCAYPLREHAVGALIGLGAIGGAGRQMPAEEVLRKLALRLSVPDYRATISKTLQEVLDGALLLDRGVREAAELLLNERIRTKELRHDLAMRLYAIHAPEPLRYLSDCARIPYREGEWRLKYIEALRFDPPDYMAAKAVLRLQDSGLAKAFANLKKEERDRSRFPDGRDDARRRMLAWVLLREHFEKSQASKEIRHLALATALALILGPGETARSAAEDLLRVFRAEFGDSPMVEPLRRWVNGVLDPVQDQRVFLAAMLDVVDPPVDSRGAPATHSELKSDEPEFVFRRSGGGWEARFQGESAPLGDLIGFAYIADLLGQPDKSIPSVSLQQARSGRGPEQVSLGAAMEAGLSAAEAIHEDEEDAKDSLGTTAVAIEEVRRRIATAEKRGNAAELAKARELMAQLEKMENEATRIIQGREPRGELMARIHNGVSKAITTARNAIRGKGMKNLCKHLQSFIRSEGGRAFSYRPPDPAPPWKFL